jgi:hypothetical protein
MIGQKYLLLLLCDEKRPGDIPDCLIESRMKRQSGWAISYVLAIHEHRPHTVV